jgi:DNA-binding FrmR family transcriptional regulator
LTVVIKPFIIKLYPPLGGGVNKLVKEEAMNKEKKQAIRSLQTSKGQIEATIKMIEDGRYCIDVSNQILAAQSLLKKANMLILKQHMAHCVKEAFEHGNESAKIEEIMGILDRVAGK